MPKIPLASLLSRPTRTLQTRKKDWKRKKRPVANLLLGVGTGGFLSGLAPADYRLEKLRLER